MSPSARLLLVPAACALFAAVSLHRARAEASPGPVLDEAELIVSLGETGEETVRKYLVRVRGVVVGKLGMADRVRVDWKQGGKTLATVECRVDGGSSAAESRAPFSCEQTDGPLTAYGDVQAELSYMSDADDKQLPLRTLHLKVGRFWGWHMVGSKTAHHARYQIVPGDLLGSAIARHDRESPDHGLVHFYFWTVTGNDSPSYGDETLRCSVDGTKLTDMRAGAGNQLVAETEDWRGPNEEKHTVTWTRLKIQPTILMWGKREALDENQQAAAAKGVDLGDNPFILLGDHPGAWSCDWRRMGKVLRTFKFRVGPDGLIAPHAEQTAASGALRLPSSEAMVEVHFPATVEDAYFDPAAIRAGGFYGRPWSDKAAQTALPAAKGSAELAPPKGAR